MITKMEHAQSNPKHSSSSEARLYNYARAQQWTGRSSSPYFRKAFEFTHAKRLPEIMREKEIILPEFDKIFAAEWLNESEVVCGTKCNSLLIVNVETKKVLRIPTLLGRRRDGRSTTAASSAGIHGIAINPSRTLLATGGANPNHIGVYHLPSFEPFCVCEGHADWVFSLSWLTDDILVSGSRDRKVCTWSMRHYTDGQGATHGMYAPQNAIQTVPARQPVVSRGFHTGKVRDLKYNHDTKQLATLSSDTSVKFWDAAELLPVSTVTLQHNAETVCIGLDNQHNQYGVGSQSHISFIDPRTAKVTFDIDSLDCGWGVRSVSFRHDIVTIGGGLGRLSFFDLRAMGYINLKPTAPTPVIGPSMHTADNICSYYHNTGKGWLKPSETLGLSGSFPIYNAAYAHCYDPTGERLFVGGGPLQLGLSGCYAGVWS